MFKILVPRIIAPDNFKMMKANDQYKVIINLDFFKIML